MKRTRYSLYTTLGLIVVITVVSVMTIHSTVSYFSVKNKIFEEAKKQSRNTIVSLQKNIANYIEAYAVNEYENLLLSEMAYVDFFAIIVSDLNMGEVLGLDEFVTGKIRDDNWNVIKFDPKNEQHNQQLGNCFYSETSVITSASGSQLGTITICSSDHSLKIELKQAIKGDGIKTALISLLLILFLFLIIRRIVLKPVSGIIEGLSRSDETGIPIKKISTQGSLEISTLASSINNMIETIRHSRTMLEEKNKELHKLSQAVEQSPATVVITDIDGNIEYVNPKFVKTTGYSLDEAIGQNPRILKSGKTTKEEYEKLWATISGGNEWRGEFHNLHKDGSPFWEMASVTPIKANDGTITNYLAVKEDITERKIIEHDLVVAKEEAEKANMAKSDFLAAMSHDLRTPLNAIMGFSQMMKQQAFGPLGNPHYEAYANDIHDSGSILVSLINDVLDLSKIEAGKYELAEETVGLKKLIKLSSRQFIAMADLAQIKMITTIVPDDLKLLGDERALTQVVNNVLSNAIKFSPNGGEVVVSASMEADESIVIRVSDQGIGMTDDDIVKALKPFQQVDQSDSMHARKYEGTGLGLHLCNQLIKLFKGTIDIDSEKDQGTTVTLQFPVERTIF